MFGGYTPLTHTTSRPPAAENLLRLVQGGRDVEVAAGRDVRSGNPPVTKTPTFGGGEWNADHRTSRVAQAGGNPAQGMMTKQLVSMDSNGHTSPQIISASSPPGSPVKGIQRESTGSTAPGTPWTTNIRDPHEWHSPSPEKQTSSWLGGLVSSVLDLKNCCGPEAESQCTKVLAELEEALAASFSELQATDESHRPQICSVAMKNCRRLDREAAALVVALSRKSHTAGSLQSRYDRAKKNLEILEVESRPYMKESQSAVAPRGFWYWLKNSLGGESRILCRRLDELELALDRFDTAAEVGQPCADDYRRTDRASAEFEDFRLRRGSAGTTQDAAKMGAKLLLGLRGSSKWCDSGQVQNLLRRRNAYLCRHRFVAATSLLSNYGQNRTNAARQFLEHGQGWEEILCQTLGTNGAADWKDRARKILQMDGHVSQTDGVADCGVLVIRHIRAFNLPKLDFWDDSDPYIIFSLGDREEQTSVIWNCNNPEWRLQGEDSWEEVLIEVDSIRQNPILGILVKDYDRFSADDVVGKVDEGGCGGISIIDAFLGRLAQAAPQAEAKDSFGPARSPITHNLPHVEVCANGSIRCHVALKGMPVRGFNEQPCASVSFEISFDTTGANGDPLVVHPVREDEALILVGQADHVTASNRQAFESASLGFFLEPVPSTPGGISSEIIDEVCEYNQLLSLLAVLTTDPSKMGRTLSNSGLTSTPVQEKYLENVAGMLSEETLHTPSAPSQIAANVAAVQEFSRAVHTIRSFESRARNDQHRRYVFTHQDELLPSIGDWSMERRKALRNQVFLAKRHLEPDEDDNYLGNFDVQVWLPMLICAIIAVYGLVMAILQWTGSWEAHRLNMIVATVIALAAIISICGCGAWQIFSVRDRSDRPSYEQLVGQT